MAFDDISNYPGLRLCLGLQDEPPEISSRTTDDENCNQKKKEGDQRNKAYPSLTLGPTDNDNDDEDEANKIQIPVTTTKTATESGDKCFHPQAASFPSAVSSFSNSTSIIKRERDHELLLELDHQVVDEKVVIPSSGVVHLDENGGNAKKKLRLTKEQSALLEDSFKHNSTLNPNQKQELATKLNLRARQVEVWFQNRRARTKLKQSEVENEVLKKCCETLREENMRLQMELQELKSTIIMKTTATTTQQGRPSLYVQLPVAGLTICPCCEKISGGGGGNSSNNNSNNGLPSPTKKALLIGSKVAHPQYFYTNQTNCSFTQQSSYAAC